MPQQGSQTDEARFWSLFELAVTEEPDNVAASCKGSHSEDFPDGGSVGRSSGCIASMSVVGGSSMLSPKCKGNDAEDEEEKTTFSIRGRCTVHFFSLLLFRLITKGSPVLSRDVVAVA